MAWNIILESKNLQISLEGIAQGIRSGDRRLFSKCSLLFQFFLNKTSANMFVSWETQVQQSLVRPQLSILIK